MAKFSRRGRRSRPYLPQECAGRPRSAGRVKGWRLGRRRQAYPLLPIFSGSASLALTISWFPSPATSKLGRSSGAPSWSPSCLWTWEIFSLFKDIRPPHRSLSYREQLPTFPPPSFDGFHSTMAAPPITFLARVSRVLSLRVDHLGRKPVAPYRAKIDSLREGQRRPNPIWCPSYSPVTLRDVSVWLSIQSLMCEI